MKKVEAFKSDDGRLFEDRIDCARADYYTALDHLRSAANHLQSHAADSHTPRDATRKALRVLQLRLRNFEQCLGDLDHYDEDPTDPERIAAAKKAEERAALAVMAGVRIFLQKAAANGDTNAR